MVSSSSGLLVVHLKRVSSVLSTGGELLFLRAEEYMLTRIRYKFVDSIVWAKTNQMNATVTSGRTGHWLNHMKEVCLVGLRGRPKLNRNLDLNVIVEQIQDTSHKPETVSKPRDTNE